LNLKRELSFLRERLRRREGRKPSAEDVSISYPGRPFNATPNFYYFAQCGRPCYLPIYPGPRLGGRDWAVTEGWPCEFYSRHERTAGPHCYCETGVKPGDWVQVVAQVRGQMITNEIGHRSDIWDVILLPREKATRNVGLLVPADQESYYGLASDMWLGNTGWHGIPFHRLNGDPWPK